MLSLADVVARHTTMAADDLAHLERLVEQWDLLADLSFSDLILWVPDAEPDVFWAAAQVRPTTGPTALEDDVVGDDLTYELDSPVMEAFLSEEITHISGNKLNAGIPVDQHAVPIVRHGRSSRSSSCTPTRWACGPPARWRRPTWTSPTSSG